MSDTPRRTLRQWLRRAPALPARPGALSSPALRPPTSAPPASPRALASPGEAWPLICEQVALRVLAAAYQMAEQVERAESEEQDPARLDQLYRIDHGLTRIRRQAEIMQVLTGRSVDDARRQITTLLDVIRAATSAIEHYPRVDVRSTVDLAIVDFAADDLIRVLTELLDNATRFSPPGDLVTVSAHLTETGSILIRVEDNGVGMPADRLTALNGLLSGDRMPVLGLAGELRLGLHVVARLAETHRMRANLLTRPGGGTTATVLVPAHLVCENPQLDGRRSSPHLPAGSPTSGWDPASDGRSGSDLGAPAGVGQPRPPEPDGRSLSGRWANRSGAHAAAPTADGRGAPFGAPTSDRFSAPMSNRDGAPFHAPSADRFGAPLADRDGARFGAPMADRNGARSDADRRGWPADDASRWSGPDSEVVELPDWRGGGGLPRRVTMSVRGSDPAAHSSGAQTPAPPAGATSWADDVANFAAGFADGLAPADSAADTEASTAAPDAHERPARPRRSRKTETTADAAPARAASPSEGTGEETA
jgi:two-component sensor histidine kinase